MDEPRNISNGASISPAYLMKLYIAGTTPNSIRAVANLRAICDEFLKNRYELIIIDIYANPGAIQEADILAAPTLVKVLPEPVRTFIGDMSDKERLLIGLEIQKSAPLLENES